MLNRLKHNYTDTETANYRRRSKRFRLSITAICLVVIIAALYHRLSARHPEVDEVKAQPNVEAVDTYEPCYNITPAPPVVAEPVAEPEPEPEPMRYTYQDVDAMVQKVAHENYYANAWQIDQDNWIMYYSTGEGRNERHFLRRFNVYKKTYDGVIAVKKVGDGKFVETNNRHKQYIYEGPCLVYYYKGVEKGRWPHNGHMLIELDTPEEPYEGYESWEDYFEDNAEDLYYYYHG